MLVPVRVIVPPLISPGVHRTQGLQFGGLGETVFPNSNGPLAALSVIEPAFCATLFVPGSYINSVFVFSNVIPPVPLFVIASEPPVVPPLPVGIKMYGWL